MRFFIFDAGDSSLYDGEPPPAKTDPELGAPRPFFFDLKWHDLFDPIFKEFSIQIKAKTDVFSKVGVCVDATSTKDVNP